MPRSPRTPQSTPRRRRTSPLSPPQTPQARRQGGNAPWEQKHNVILVTGIIRMVNANRAVLYSLPGIVGEVDNNGNDRTGRHVTRILQDLARVHGLDPAIVKENKRSPAKKPRRRQEVTHDLEAMDEDEDERSPSPKPTIFSASPEPVSNMQLVLRGPSRRRRRRNSPVPPGTEVHTISDDE